MSHFWKLVSFVSISEEELVCLGSWKDGTDHYFAGKINHSHVSTNEDRYRCFMYEKARHDHFAPDSEDDEDTEPLWRLTMSNDAACQSLNSVRDAAKIMKLRKRKRVSEEEEEEDVESNWRTLWYQLPYAKKDDIW